MKPSKKFHSDKRPQNGTLSESQPPESQTLRLSRRAVLQGGALLLATTSTALAANVFESDEKPALRIGLLTDMHHADKAPLGTRHYRETLNKLAEAATQFATAKPNFIVELGDLIDAADSPEVELKYLEEVNKHFAAICTDRHYVLGNHCVDMLTKAEFLGKVGQGESYYSFDRNGLHFVVLDMCFRSDEVPYGRKNSKWDDANVPKAELEWLRADLQKASGKTIVFAHQRLDGENQHCAKNAAEVRRVLIDSKKVAVVLQGHSHQNDYKEIDGIHFCTLAAMIEGSGADNNSYSTLDLHADGTLKLSGFRKQANYKWKSG